MVEAFQDVVRNVGIVPRRGNLEGLAVNVMIRLCFRNIGEMSTPKHC